MLHPEVEGRSLDPQLQHDDAAFRRQIAYLFARSPFYRRKLMAAGFKNAESVGGIENIANLPVTDKSEIRESQKSVPPFGDHLAADPKDLMRIYSTSGTTGTPTYIGVTKNDMEVWATNTARSYYASGFRPGQPLVVTFNAGPFVAGGAYFGFDKLGCTVIPIGLGNTERLVAALQNLGGGNAGLSCTPSYALHLMDWCNDRGIDTKSLGLKNVSVAGEPGGGDPLVRERVESAFGCMMREAMGTGDISTSIWGECEFGGGMHFSSRGNTFVELIDPETRKPLPWDDGAQGEIVYTALVREAMPLLRLCSRDHIVVNAQPCKCGRTSHRIRCIGRTDDMLIVRGVNLFPTAIGALLEDFVPHVSGFFRIMPTKRGVAQTPPLPVSVELGQNASETPADLAEKIKAAIRAKLVVTTEVTLVPYATLPRGEYKSKLVDFSKAEG
jgi:phenylacetate-CoA ligase